MTPVRLSTLAELGIEFRKVWSQHVANVSAEEADPSRSFAGCASDLSAKAIGELSDQIEALPAASIADLRVKALALSYWQEGSALGDGCWSNEENLSRQIVAGLLNEGEEAREAPATKPEDIADIPFEGQGVDVNDLMPDRDQWQVQWTFLWMMLSTLNDDKEALTAKLVAMETGGASEAFLNSLDTLMAENKRPGELLEAVHNRVLVAAANAIGEMEAGSR